MGGDRVQTQRFGLLGAETCLVSRRAERLVELLDFLTSRGLPLAVATSARRTSAEHHLDKAGLLDRFAASVDTVLAVWTGTRGSLSLAGCNDDVSDTDTSSAITLTVSSGTTYYIEVAGTAPPVSMFRPEAPTLGGILQFHMDFIGDTFLPVILQNSP